MVLKLHLQFQLIQNKESRSSNRHNKPPDWVNAKYSSVSFKGHTSEPKNYSSVAIDFRLTTIISLGVSLRDTTQTLKNCRGRS